MITKTADGIKFSKDFLELIQLNKNSELMVEIFNFEKENGPIQTTDYSPLITSITVGNYLAFETIMDRFDRNFLKVDFYKTQNQIVEFNKIENSYGSYLIYVALGAYFFSEVSNKKRKRKITPYDLEKTQYGKIVSKLYDLGFRPSEDSNFTSSISRKRTSYLLKAMDDMIYNKLVSQC